MYPRLLQSFAGALISLALLAALAGGLIWLLGMQTRQAAPVALPATPTAPDPEPTSTPLPTATPMPQPPVNSRAEIIAALELLAGRELAAYAGDVWVRSVIRDPDAGDAQTLTQAYTESWVHFSGGECREMLILSADGPEMAQMHSLQIGLADGVFGELTALRRGEHESLNREWSCVVGPAETDAGMLAARLQPGEAQLQIKGPNRLEKVQAGYENRAGRLTLAVEAVFSAESGPPEVQRETRRFDAATGRMLEEQIKMEWADGSPYGEFARVKSVELLPALPAEAAVRFAQAEAELRAILSAVDAGGSATPMPTVRPTADAAALAGLSAYTQAAPLKDAAAIRAALQALQLRHLDWMLEPGWIVFRPADAGARKWDQTYSALLHGLPDGSCDLLTFYIQDEAVLPQEIHLADGRWGLVGSVQEGVLTEGSPADGPCRRDDLIGMQIYAGLIDSAADVRPDGSTGGLQAWVETRSGRTVLVIYLDRVFSPGSRPSTMDPDTRRLEPQARSEQWTFFDLETGAFAGSAYLAHLQSGKVFGEPYAPGGPLSETAVRLDAPPADLALALETMLNKLQAYLAARP